jgi:Protein of unknown function (DUF1761)
MKSIEFEFLSVLIATIIYMAIGFLWYSPFLFKKQWLKYFKPNIKNMKMDLKTFIFSSTSAFVLCAIFSLLIGFLEVNTALDGLFVGFGIWFGFVATTQLSAVIWKKEAFGLFLIDSGYYLISFCIIGAFLGT